MVAKKRECVYRCARVRTLRVGVVATWQGAGADGRCSFAKAKATRLTCSVTHENNQHSPHLALLPAAS